MRFAPVNAEFQANKRVVAASFVAGIGAMVFMGLVAPVAAKGGLSLASAEARGFERTAPMIEPLDVAAINATLAEAERSMALSRMVTDSAINRLERLSNR
jgi:hypothetical protein